MNIKSSEIRVLLGQYGARLALYQHDEKVATAEVIRDAADRIKVLADELYQREAQREDR